MARQLLVALSLLLAGLGAVQGAAAEPALRLSHVRPPGSAADVDLGALANEIARSTSVRIHIFPNSALGDYSTVQKQLGEGVVDMALQPIAPEPDRRFKIGNLPYLAHDWADARARFGKGGPVRRAMEALFEQQGIQLLAVYPQYFGGASFAKDPRAVPRDTLPVRVPKAHAHFASTLGFKPVELAFSDIQRSFKSGAIEGIIGSGAEGYYVSFLDHTKFYLVANTHFEAWYLLMNKRRFNDLAPRDKEGLARALAYFEALRWSRAEVLQAFNEKRLRDAGVVILRPTRAELERTATEVRRTVWPGIFDEIGRTYAESVLGESK